MTDFSTPRELGFFMPAEWEKQSAVFLTWPLNPETWMDNRSSFEKAYADFAAAISCYETVKIVCIREKQEQAAELLNRSGAQMERIIFYDIPSNDAWCRDHGPIFLKNRGNAERMILDFHYNAWGGKFAPWDADDAIPRSIAEKMNLPSVRVPFICEGGALEVNGAGTLLTTESVVLNGNRNPGASRADAERILSDSLGLEQVLFLKSGLSGDDTDGHIDTLTRFFRKNAVLTAFTEDRNSPNYEVLSRNYEDLKRMRLPDGSPLEVVRLPMPDPIYPENWREDILPATYANFLIVNDAVLVPTYRQEENDAQALEIIGGVFPGRDIVPLDCFDIILEGGALHCLSQQEPE